MMTELEQRLADGTDLDYSRQLREMLEEAQRKCRRKLMRGNGPEQYQEALLETQAFEAAIHILNTLEEH